MATKEDILEQIVENYLIQKGYFVQHNIKYRPSEEHPDYDSSKDSVHSDIDIVGFHPSRGDKQKVLAVSCKSWQAGFNPEALIDAINKGKILGGKPAWKPFRELTVNKWSEAFTKKVTDVTGESHITHVTAITRLIGDKTVWEEHEPFRQAINNPLQILTLTEMIKEFQKDLSKTLARTEVGRILQLFAAAKIKLQYENEE